MDSSSDDGQISDKELFKKNQITEMLQRNSDNVSLVEQNDPKLKYLYIEEFITYDDAYRLFDALTQNNVVTTLEWSHKYRLDDDLAVELVDGLRKNKSITFLNLSKNMVNDDGIVKLAEMLETNTILKSLNLSAMYWQGIEDDVNVEGKISNSSLFLLAQSLTVNRTLTHLFLSENKIDNDGAKYLAEALSKNKGLRVLDLSMNLIGDDGFSALAVMLKQNDTLTKLMVGFNNFTVTGVMEMMNAVKYNTRLKTLQMERMYGYEPDELKEMVALLEKNTSLTKLKLSDFPIILVDHNMKDILIRNRKLEKKKYDAARKAADTILNLGTLKAFQRMPLDIVRQWAEQVWSSRDDPIWLEADNASNPSKKLKSNNACIQCNMQEAKWAERDEPKNQYCGSYCQWMLHVGSKYNLPDVRGMQPEHIQTIFVK